MKDENMTVSDLRGRAFDISISSIGDGVVEAKTTNKGTRLGGGDWDSRLIDWFTDTFQKANAIDLRTSPGAIQGRKDEPEKDKIALSSVLQVDMNPPFIPADGTGSKIEPLH
jgi:molecular chaperone DnaK